MDIGLLIFAFAIYKAELKQTLEAFRKVEELGRYDGPLNLARALVEEGGEGMLDEAAAALQRAAAHKEPAAPPWPVAWLSGVINRQQGKLAEAEENFRSVLEYKSEDTIKRGFDFSQDYIVINLLGVTIFDRTLKIRGADEDLWPSGSGGWKKRWRCSSEHWPSILKTSMLITTLQLYANLGDKAKAEEHQAAHTKYKTDDTARGEAVAIARKKYPASGLCFRGPGDLRPAAKGR